MSSTGKCEYCGGTVRSDEKYCPSCGAANPNYVADTPRTIFLLRTIDELKEYCAERGMPLLRMRFFIGDDYREPKAFGIYKDGDDYVVYKNKANGQRAVRYRGPDEAHAVDEIFTKLLEECHNRGIYPDGKPEAGSGARDGNGGNRRGSKRASRLLPLFIALWVAVAAVATIGSFVTHRKDGYYHYNNYVYYHYGNDWYYTSDYDANWYAVDEFPYENYDDYYAGEDYDSDWGVGDFKDSAAWEEIQESHSSSSSDYDSWDSSDTDWDSDW